MKPTYQRILRAAVLVLGSLSLNSAFAQGPSGSQWGLGATVGFEKKPYRDFDDKAQLLPILFYENRWIRLAGTTLDLKLSSSESFRWGPRLRFSGEGYEAEDSPFLKGMDERKSSFWAGAAASWDMRWATLSAEVLGDASGNSKGSRMSLGVERRFASGSFDFTPRVAAHHVDKKYANYYYGVRSEEATALRPLHGGKATTNLEFGLQIGYALAPKQRLSLDLSTTRLGSSIKDSPLVDRTKQDNVRLTYLYLF